MKKKIFHILMLIIAFLLASLLLSIAYYWIFSLLCPTDLQKRLEEENGLYRRELDEAEKIISLMEKELDFLERRDGNIYKTVFRSETILLEDFLDNVGLEDIDAAVSRIGSNWDAIYANLTASKTVVPVISPIANLTATGISASVGERMNPFYRVDTYHDGLDIIASANTPVRATASGVVSEVKRSPGGKGNLVEIIHSGGYVTRYSHLERALVSKGERVKCGKVIGLVGESGRSFTTHLHYEVLKDGRVLDPVYMLAGSATPGEHLKMVLVSLSSGQSLD